MTECCFVEGRLMSSIRLRAIVLNSTLAALAGLFLSPTVASDRSDDDVVVDLTLVSRSREFTNSIGMKLVLVEAGKFMMGAPANEPERENDEGPYHAVEITKDFYLGVT